MEISVGILAAQEINVFFRGEYRESTTSTLYTQKLKLSWKKGQVEVENTSGIRLLSLPLCFCPQEADSSTFELSDVTIGIHFHWERKENQRFKGRLKIIAENGQLRAVNILDIEDYLQSVISSEMSAMSFPELLKTHAVISRSWLLAQRAKAECRKGQTAQTNFINDTSTYIRWYDREDHLYFDVCADDHCQRYQGIQKITAPAVRQAIEATRGEILTYQGEVCDTRFSKCCGGITENFENVWEKNIHPYLKSVPDTPEHTPFSYDLTQEAAMERWVKEKPNVFCHTNDKNILANVLNDYDQETTDFFRWEVYYTQQELSELIRNRLGMDFGQIEELIPIERGPSGRLIRLQVVGSKKSRIIGKELLIRKALSPTHLYSSAFIVEKKTADDKTCGFRLIGAGWGHGVGLCQIGAAVMSYKGYTYREILRHYFPGTEIEQLKEK